MICKRKIHQIAITLTDIVIAMSHNFSGNDHFCKSFLTKKAKNDVTFVAVPIKMHIHSLTSGEHDL